MQKLLRQLDGHNLSEKLSKYLAVALLIIVPLYPKFPFLNIPGIYVSIRLEDFLLVIMAMFTVFKLAPKLKSLFKDRLTRSIFLFLFIGLASLISGAFLTKTITFPIGFLHLFRRVEYFIPFFFALSFVNLRKKENIEFYVKTIAVVIFALFVYGLGQRYFNFPVIITQNEEYSKGIALSWTEGAHISSTFGGHYDLASYLVLVLPIFVSLFFIFKDRVSKMVTGLTVLSGFWLLVNSLSRVSFVSYLVAVSVSLLLMKKYKAVVAVVLISLVLSGQISRRSIPLN